jgi:hypothetical protein
VRFHPLTMVFESLHTASPSHGCWKIPASTTSARKQSTVGQTSEVATVCRCYPAKTTTQKPRRTLLT